MTGRSLDHSGFSSYKQLIKSVYFYYYCYVIYKLIFIQSCEIIESMGFPILESSFGEGEKACAYLNLIDRCDGIITNDGDALLYGCNILYKNFKLKNKVQDL